MIREMALANALEMTAETLLWRGVIARTIQDWLSKPLRPKREAERYLFENSADLVVGLFVGGNRCRATAHPPKLGAGSDTARPFADCCVSHVVKSGRKKGMKNAFDHETRFN